MLSLESTGLVKLVDVNDAKSAHWIPHQAVTLETHDLTGCQSTLAVAKLGHDTVAMLDHVSPGEGWSPEWALAYRRALSEVPLLQNPEAEKHIVVYYAVENHEPKHPPTSIIARNLGVSLQDEEITLVPYFSSAQLPKSIIAQFPQDPESGVVSRLFDAENPELAVHSLLV
jgi:hypothetical protein